MFLSRGFLRTTFVVHRTVLNTQQATLGGGHAAEPRSTWISKDTLAREVGASDHATPRHGHEPSMQTFIIFPKLLLEPFEAEIWDALLKLNVHSLCYR